MLIFVDVTYGTAGATAAAVGAMAWTDSATCFQSTIEIEAVAEYVPGEFYRRELPAILAALRTCPRDVEAVVVDSYVWLDHEVPGLGKRLYDALDGATPVVGVAKSVFRTAIGVASAVVRGSSARPLSVSTVGCSQVDAAEAARTMHGKFRIPTLLRQVDALSRRPAAARG